MNRGSIIFYISIILILLLPNTFGRFIIDLVGSVFLLTIIIPILISLIGWTSWKIIKSRSQVCDSCGYSFFGNLDVCPMCGSKDFKKVSSEKNSDYSIDIPASDATIDIIPKEDLD